MADQQPHLMAMDSSMTPEFGSKGYFDKFEQLNAHQQQQQSPTHNTLDSPTSTPLSANFVLPLRDSKFADKSSDPKRERKGFFSLCQKVSILHQKPSTFSPSSSSLAPRSSVDSNRKSASFDQLFFALPNELKIQIITFLPLTDVLNLRILSKSWLTIITLNEAIIARYHLDHHIPAYASRLYPVKDKNEVNFHHLCGLWHRLHVAAKLSYSMCEWITKDLFLRQTEAQRLAFAPQSERMRRRLIPLLFTIFHFLETYQKLYLKYLAENNGRGLKRNPYTVNPIEAEIMSMYDDRTLLRVHEVFPLVISSFNRRLRPPTYVGRVERSLRGYIRDKPSDDVHVAILLLGGLRQVERLWAIKGYNNRRSAVDSHLNSLTKDQTPSESAAPAKSKRGLRSFGRKKQTNGDARSPDVVSYKPRSSGSIDGNTEYDVNFVFNTSLSAGAPMSSLSPQQARIILSDLPVLQQLWLATAEATILERRIVERPQDIRRNQQVMLDLIREGGIDEENEWWYGRNITDSVRPHASSTDEDME